MKKSTPAKRKTVKRWTPPTRSNKKMPEELPLDASWDTIYTAGTPSGTSGDYIDDELPVYQGETTQTLQDYLMWQVELTPFSDTDRAIATSIVDAVDDTGYLTVPLEDILESMGDEEIDIDEVEAVLKRINGLIRSVWRQKICVTAC